MSYKDTIGFRANNYGNIRFNTSNNWLGQIGFEESARGDKFVKFKEPVYGVRAMFKLLDRYIRRKQNTINDIINIYAPSGDGDNNPSSYAEKVSQRSGVPQALPLKTDDKEKLVRIVHAMIVQEIGFEAPIDMIENAYDLAVGVEKTVLTAANDRSNVAIIEAKKTENGAKNLIVLAVLIVLGVVYRVFFKG